MYKSFQKVLKDLAWAPEEIRRLEPTPAKDCRATKDRFLAKGLNLCNDDSIFTTNGSTCPTPKAAMWAYHKGLVIFF
jgi:hypothetical protein